MSYTLEVQIWKREVVCLFFLELQMCKVRFRIGRWSVIRFRSANVQSKMVVSHICVKCKSVQSNVCNREVVSHIGITDVFMH